VTRFPLWHFPIGHRYLFKVLSLAPFSSLKSLTMPFNPILPTMWHAASQLRRGRARAYDLVHATAFPYSFPLACAARAAKRMDVPLFLTPFVHLGDLENLKNPIRKAYLAPHLLDIAKSASQVFVQTASEAEALCDLGVTRITLQGLGVDLADCIGGDRLRARLAWGIPCEEKVIGHLANNSEEKGSVDLCLACERLWQRGEKFTLVLAGPEMPNFAQFWQTFRPSGRIVRGGYLSEQEKRDFYAAIDCFALPSRSDSFGLVLVEAWANGVGCVVYRAGGPGSLVRDGADGYVVRCGDLAALASALQRGLSEGMLGEVGRGRLHEFDWDKKLQVVAQAMELTRGS
jgi:glycosyltransferase involved in cell wall biosynthesis